MFMLKRTVALFSALMILLALVPAAAVSAAVPATGRVQGVCVPPEGDVSPAAAETATANGENVPPAAAVDITVDYLSILGITEATAQKFADRVKQTLLEYRLECDVSDLGIKVNPSSSQQKNAFGAMMACLVYQSYETCMYDYGTYSWEYDTGNYTVLKISFFSEGFQFEQKDFYDGLNRLYVAADHLLEGIRGNGALTAVQKALLLHDRLAVWCEYDYDDYLADTLPPVSYTAIGALANRLAVCQGYAEAYSYLLSEVGIKNRVCQSQNLHHTWNIVEIGGKEYYVDVTWDDPYWDRTGQVRHDNFLISLNELIATGHNTTDYPRIPQVSTYDGYFWKESHTEFQVLNGSEIYYIDNVDGDTAMPHNATLYQWAAGALYARCNITADVQWKASNGGVWSGNYSMLSSYNGELYFNTAKQVWRFDPSTNTVSSCFTPEMPNSAYSIFGFTIANGRFYLDLFSDFPNSQSTLEGARYHYNFKDVRAVAVTKKPDQTVYAVGDSFNGKGMELTVTYTDGTTEVITAGYEIANWNSATAGTKTVTVSFRGVGTTFTVKVQNMSVAVPAVTVGTNGVTLTWKANQAVAGYYVLRCEYKNGKQTEWDMIATTEKTSYTDKAVASGGIYAYTIATHSQGTVHYNDPTDFCYYLSAPAFSTVNAAGGMTVSWKKIAGATGYTVYRATYSAGKWSSWTGIKNTASLSYTDSTAKAGVIYRYTVRAYNAGGRSAYVAGSGLYRLPNPKVTTANAAGGITVSWGKVTGAKGYTLYYRSYNSNTKKWSGWTKIGNTTKTAYTFTKGTAGVNYQFTARAYNGSSVSAYTASATTVRLPNPKVTTANASSGIAVSWGKVTGAKGYTLYYRSYNSSTKKWSGWVRIGNTTKTAYTFTKGKAGVNYQFTARAYNGSSVSAYTASTTVRRLTVPAVTVKKSGSSIKASWKKVTGAGSYVVYRSVAGQNKWTKLGTTTNLTFTDKTAKAGTYYQYTVRAVYGSSTSAYKASSKIKR